jgi:hypothetical protein
MRKKYILLGFFNLCFIICFSQDGNKKTELKNSELTTPAKTNKTVEKKKQAKLKLAESNLDETQKLDRKKTAKKPELLQMKNND